MTPDDPMPITDTTDGRCASGINITGEAFRCDYNINHAGWAHSSKAAEAIWQDDVIWGDDQ